MSEDMKKQIDKIGDIADAEGLTPEEKRTLTLLILSRFPNENSVSYIAEWARRIQSGQPERYADDTTAFILALIDGMR